MVFSRQDVKVAAVLLGVIGVGSAVAWWKQGGPFAAPPAPLRLVGVHPKAEAPSGDRGVRPVPVNVNTATAEELERLPGLGPMLARRIIQERSSRGPFRNLEDLGRVKGLGPKMLSRLTPWLKMS